MELEKSGRVESSCQRASEVTPNTLTAVSFLRCPVEDTVFLKVAGVVEPAAGLWAAVEVEH